MGDLENLHRRLLRAASRGKGIALSAQELDLVTSLGAIDIVSSAVAKEVKELAERRLREDREVAPAPPVAPVQGERLKTSANAAVEEALARVQSALRSRPGRGKRATSITPPRRDNR